MSEFHHGQEVGPLFRFVGGEQPQIGFQFLIYLFGLPIHLGMVCSGEGDIVLEEVGKFSGEGRGELRSPVRDHLGMEAELRENVSEKEFGDSCGINVFCAGAINYPLRKAMVYHDHN